IALWCALGVLALQHVPGAGLREERIKSMGVIGLNQCMQPHVMSRGARKVVCMTVTSRMMRLRGVRRTLVFRGGSSIGTGVPRVCAGPAGTDTRTRISCGGPRIATGVPRLRARVASTTARTRVAHGGPRIGAVVYGGRGRELN